MQRSSEILHVEAHFEGFASIVCNLFHFKVLYYPYYRLAILIKLFVFHNYPGDFLGFSCGVEDEGKVNFSVLEICLVILTEFLPLFDVSVAVC